MPALVLLNGRAWMPGWTDLTDPERAYRQIAVLAEEQFDDTGDRVERIRVDDGPDATVAVAVTLRVGDRIATCLGRLRPTPDRYWVDVDSALAQMAAEWRAARVRVGAVHAE